MTSKVRGTSPGSPEFPCIVYVLPLPVTPSVKNNAENKNHQTHHFSLLENLGLMVKQ